MQRKLKLTGRSRDKSKMLSQKVVQGNTTSLNTILIVYQQQLHAEVREAGGGVDWQTERGRHPDNGTILSTCKGKCKLCRKIKF